MPDIPKPWEQPPEVPSPPDAVPDAGEQPEHSDLQGLLGLGSSSLGGSVEVPDELRPDITRPPDVSEEGTQPFEEPTRQDWPVEEPNDRRESDADAVSDTGDPPDQPPPIDLPGSAEFPGDETVLDMPEEERQGLIGVLEQFAAGGERVEQGYTIIENGERRTEWDNSYERTLPRSLLAAEGLPYDRVEVIVKDTTDGTPYSVSMRASRTVPVDADLPEMDMGAGQPTQGEETKDVTFTSEVLDPALEPVWTMSAESKLIVVSSEEAEPDPDYPIPTHNVTVGMDENAPLLRLDEARAVARAIETANALPPDAPELTNVYPIPESANHPGGAADTDTSRQRETYLDITQEQRQQVVNDINGYARSGATPAVDGSLRRYERAIPEEILREYGIAGTVRAIVMERPDGEHFRYALTETEWIERTLPEFGSEGIFYGLKQNTYAFFEVGGDRDGTGGLGSSDDPTGGTGIHIEHAAEILYWERPEDVGDVSKAVHAQGVFSNTYEDLTKMCNALRQARQA